MRTVSGLFDTHDEARRAVHALEDAGIPSDDISVVSRHGDATADGGLAAEGAGVGAAVGGVSGLLAGLGAFSIAGIGPVVGAGWLATTLLGAAAGGVAGGMIGSLTAAGVDAADARIYAEGLRRGGALVTARVEETKVPAARSILTQHNAIDTAARRKEYEGDAWDGFADKDIWDSDIGSEDLPASDDAAKASSPR